MERFGLCEVHGIAEEGLYSLLGVAPKSAALLRVAKEAAQLCCTYFLTHCHQPQTARGAGRWYQPIFAPETMT